MANGRSGKSWIVRTMGLLALLQFFLNAAQLLVGPRIMVPPWIMCGAVIAIATIQIESYLERQRRSG